jgi:hypothetical protein
VLELLALSHWPVHVHGNNWDGMTKIGLPNTLEVTFASRAAYQFEPNTERFPTPLDRPNNPAKPDLALDCFNARGL